MRPSSWDLAASTCRLITFQHWMFVVQVSKKVLWVWNSFCFTLCLKKKEGGNGTEDPLADHLGVPCRSAREVA